MLMKIQKEKNIVHIREYLNHHEQTISRHMDDTADEVSE
jgi:hypothetical protein